MNCDRDDVAAALKVPLILGRGDPVLLVIGDKRFQKMLAWSNPECGGDIEKLADAAGVPSKLRVVITIKYPDTLFAIGENEPVPEFIRTTEDDAATTKTRAEV